jgi:alpha/beta superfamily hydrolase
MTLFLLNAVTAFCIHPSRKYTMLPNDLQLRYTSKFITTPDSAKLKAWFIPAADSIKKNVSVIIAGQDAGNMSAQLLLAEALVKKGFDVVTFDYRGFGESSNFKIDSSYLYYSEFITDLISVVRNVKTSFPKNKTCILARSMGSIITSIALMEERVDYVVGDGYIKSLTDTKKRIENYRKISVKLPEDSMRFSNTLSGINAKMLIFAGKQDWVTTVDDALQIVEKYFNRKLVIHPLGHLETPKAFTQQTYADGMVDHIVSFIQSFKE